MSRHPILGTDQADARYNDAPLRIRTLALAMFRASDGIVAPLNAHLDAEYLGRSAPATIYDSNGVSGSLATSAPAFTSIAWDTVGVRDEDGLLFSDEEALRFFDLFTGELALVPGPVTLRHEWVEVGAALVADAPLWSYTNDAATGPQFGLYGAGDGTIEFRHDNDTTVVASGVAVNTGDRCAARGLLYPDGSVRLGITINGASSESLGPLSAAAALEATWGIGGGCKIRLNEHGILTRAEQIVRVSALYGGNATRQQLQEML